MDFMLVSVAIAAVLVLTAYLLIKWIPALRDRKVSPKKSRTRASKKKNPYSF